MMAELIKRIVDNRIDGKEIAFIWITVHKLHEQSKEKLEKYYENLQTVTCSFFEDLQDKQIQDKEILFFNWQSINKKKNIYIRENENEFNLSKVIENVRDENRDIILIIDESHHGANSDKSKEIIQQINPKITIEVSATPKISDLDYLEPIEHDEVIDEEMIKKSIQLNQELGNKNDSSLDELIMKNALEKRKQLKSSYEKEKSNVNPLVLIQLPTSRKGMLDKKDPIIEMLNSKFGINTDNGKLAIYLSDKENKVNLENIEKPENEVEVLIFKQAIAVGWDCPRSSILVLFREWKDIIFSIQTIGRIIRMPEQKHYKNDELNHAYVYTNIDKVTIAKDVAEDYYTIYSSTRNDDLNDPVDLRSVYIKRQHEKTRLNVEFRKIFSKITKKQNLVKRILLDVPKLKNEIITDVEILDLDTEQNLQGNSLIVKQSSMDLQNHFDVFTEEMTGKFARVHSQGIIKRAIFQFFEDNTKIVDLMEMEMLTLYPKNKKYFVKAISDATEQFTRDVVEKIKREVEYIPKWNIPESTEYIKIYKERDYKKCIMSPAYIKTNVKNEIMFMDFLEKESGVKWWFKNEVSDKKYFAIKYVDSDDDIIRGFYVDFIIRMNDGKIGLFDPKKGNTITDPKTKPKAEALSKYIKDNKSKRLFGGITVFENGEWLYNDNKEFVYDKGDFSEWKPVDLS